ncbi:hypothetical protein [Staphylococcus felis]|nr:hypothetical protein [Staphylococcus felis]
MDAEKVRNGIIFIPTNESEKVLFQKEYFRNKLEIELNKILQTYINKEE